MAVHASSSVLCFASSVRVTGFGVPPFPARSLLLLQSRIQSRRPHPGPSFLFPTFLAGFVARAALTGQTEATGCRRGSFKVKIGAVVEEARLSCRFLLRMGLAGCCRVIMLMWWGTGLDGGAEVVAIDGMLVIFPLMVGLEGI